MKAYKAKNIIAMLLNDRVIESSDEAAYKIVKAICDKYSLIPVTDTSAYSAVFHNISTEFFKDILDEKEIEVYQELWAAGVEIWEENTDDRIGPFALVTLNLFIFYYLRILRLADSTLTLETTPGTPGFVADAVFQKQAALVAAFWPNLKPERKKKPKAEPKKELDKTGKKEPEKIKLFVYGGRKMRQGEYSKWYASLSADEKTDVLGHVKVEEVEVETRIDKKASGRTK